MEHSASRTFDSFTDYIACESYSRYLLRRVRGIAERIIEL